MESENHLDSQNAAIFDELRIINNLLNRICQLRETNHIMSAIVGEMIRTTAADHGVISLIEPSRGDELQTVVRDDKEEKSSLPYKVSDQISGWVLKNRRLLKIDDIDSDDRFRNLSSEIGKVKSLICLPLIVRNEFLGLATLTRSAAKGPFTDDACRLAGILTSQSAHILHNAKLLEELATQNELLEVSRRRLNEENIKLRRELGIGGAFESIIGKSVLMKRALTLASKFASGDSAILITGETGTGKELVARAIHNSSARKDKPFVVKNCGVKTESLLESELFGHIRGSFTGALKDKIGLFKEADGGTIFLDEIGDAPLSTQAAILRVIQQGEIRPVGASKTEHVNVRVISATNKELAKEIANGNFREDLFYRLSTFTIDLPPLRRRKDDIPLLVNHILKKIRLKTGHEDLTISPAAMDIFETYNWPGNVRQLENEIERAAAIADTEKQVVPGHISPGIRAGSEPCAASIDYQGKLQDIIERVEHDVIDLALQQHGGNIMQTSKALGLTRKGLKSKIARYKIVNPNRKA